MPMLSSAIHVDHVHFGALISLLICLHFSSQRCFMPLMVGYIEAFLVDARSSLMNATSRDRSRSHHLLVVRHVLVSQRLLT